MQIVDLAEIKVVSGHGGNGSMAFRREKYVPQGGPAGGDGGQGGSVILQATSELHTLLDFQYKHIFKAENGEAGKQKKMHGRSGPDLIIRVPVGTVVREKPSGKVIGDLTADGQRLVVARGGRGGRGNTHFASSTYQTPRYAEPGKPGEEKELVLELKLIADVGLLGLPNAGKSSLLAVITSARPKIANYPFTTLTPNLGAVKFPDGDGFIVADIPGLIEGAHAGIGLGHEFLRHIERTRLLLHLVDAAAEDPIANYEIIRAELEQYPARLEDKPQLIVLNKKDIAGAETLAELQTWFQQQSPYPVHTISALTRDGVRPLIFAIQGILQEIPQPEPLELEVEEPAEQAPAIQFAIHKEKDVYVVESAQLEDMVRLSDLEDERALYRLQRRMDKSGLFQALREHGVQLGDTVRIGHFEFEYM